MNTFLLTDDLQSPKRPWATLTGTTKAGSEEATNQAPETGPGFQVVQFGQDSHSRDAAVLPPGVYIAFNAELFVELDLKNQEADEANIVKAVIGALGSAVSSASYESFVDAVQPQRVSSLPGTPTFPLNQPPPVRVPPPPPAPPFALTRIVTTWSAADDVWRRPEVC